MGLGDHCECRYTSRISAPSWILTVLLLFLCPLAPLAIIDFLSIIPYFIEMALTRDTVCYPRRNMYSGTFFRVDTQELYPNMTRREATTLINNRSFSTR